MLVLRFVARLLAASALAVCQTQAAPSRSLPVYLPLTSFWTHAVPPDQANSGVADLDEAYRRYRLGDMLSARAHLYKARASLAGAANQALRLRALSLACLVDNDGISDTYLILWSASPTEVALSEADQSDRPWEREMLSVKWKTESGGSSNSSVVSWIELFSAYQRYQHGDLRAAGKAWQSLAQNDTDPYLQGLALLGMVQVAGQFFSDAKANGQPSPNSVEGILQTAAEAERAFARVPLPFGVGQAHLLAAQVGYLAGQVALAGKEMTAADNIFSGVKLSGWADVNLIGVIGEGRAGNIAAAEDALLAVEDQVGDHRVPAAQVQALYDFVRRLPAITGIDDPRPIELKLADAREFHRWTSLTQDPMLELISLKTLSAVLREGGYWSDASFYSAVENDLSQQYRSGVPFRMRVRRAAFLDYDFLRQSKLLEANNPIPFSLSKFVEAYILLKKGAITPEELQLAGNISRSEAEARTDNTLVPLIKIAKDGDAAAAGFRSRMTAGDDAGAREALTQIVLAWARMTTALALLAPDQHHSSVVTENFHILAEGGKVYEIRTDVTADYFVHYRAETKLEFLHEQKYLMLMNQIMGAAVTGKEGYIHSGLKEITAFYDKYRKEITPPEILDIPFTLSGRMGIADFELPTEEKRRAKLMSQAFDVLIKHYINKLAEDAVAGDASVVEQIRTNLWKDSESELAALRFFNKNFQPDEGGIRVSSHQVSPVQVNGTTVITVKHAYRVNYKVKDDSEYLIAPPEAAGIDIEQRAATARGYWFDSPYAAGPVRLESILQQLYAQHVGENLMGEYMGTTPEQLIAGNPIWSSLVDAGQIALSAQSSGDFLVRPKSHDFPYWRKLFQTDSTARGSISAAAQIDPDAQDYAQQLQPLMQNLSAVVRQFDASDNSTSPQPDGAAEAIGKPLQPVLHVAGIAQSLRYRPLLFLLMDDKTSADEAAGKLLAKHQTTTSHVAPDAERGMKRVETSAGNSNEALVQDGLSLALYDLATGQYQEAVHELKPLPDILRGEDPLRVFQVEYLLAMSYRRSGDHTAELQSLRSSVEDLDRLRETLSTRNEAAGLQPLRQLIYEELIGASLSQKQYAAIFAAMNRYKRSSQMPVSVMLEPSAHDPQLNTLLQDTAFAYDVLSREEVWKVSDSGLIAMVREMVGERQAAQDSVGDHEQEVDPREFVMSGLNHIADVLIDQMRTATSAAMQSNPASPPPRADGITVSYFVGSKGLYRVAIRPSGEASTRFVALPETGVSRDCGHFRTAILEHKDPAEPGARLYEALLGEMPELPTYRHLYVSPDGPLNFIPFQALRRNQSSRYLIEDHTITYLTGAMTAPRPAKYGRHILLVGNPDGTLSAAEKEVQAIAQVPGIESADPLLGPDANLDNLRKQLPSANLVHFASHARANELQPNFAFLQLANGDRLYSFNLGGLQFSGKHVFLSACETRLGQHRPGDDIYGLADAFLAAGASSVISTLWRIESESSAIFARRYYELFAQTQNAPEALGATAREFIQGKWYIQSGGVATVLDAPMFWAGFNHLVPGSDIQ